MDLYAERKKLQDKILHIINQCVPINQMWLLDDFNVLPENQDDLDWVMNNAALRADIKRQGDAFHFHIANWWSHTQALTGITFLQRTVPINYMNKTVDISGRVSDGVGGRLLYAAIGDFRFHITVELPDTLTNICGNYPALTLLDVSISANLAEQEFSARKAALQQGLREFNKALTFSALSNTYKNLHKFAAIDESLFFQKQLPVKMYDDLFTSR